MNLNIQNVFRGYSSTLKMHLGNVCTHYTITPVEMAQATIRIITTNADL